MAYVANQQRRQYENAVGANTQYTIATFQINRLNALGGQYPFSLFKIQANWSSGSLLVNSELYINHFILDDSGTALFIKLPEGESSADYIYPISGSTNFPKYSHLLASDNSDVYNYFSISFAPITVGSPGYYDIDIVVNSPNFTGGRLIADSYCYILNTYE